MQRLRIIAGLIAVGAGLLLNSWAQDPAATKVCPACPLAGQEPAIAHFDATNFEFLSGPKPFIFQGVSSGYTIIARVLSRSPLVLEVFDSDSAAEEFSAGQAIRRIYSVNKAVEETLSSIKFNSLVQASFLFTASDDDSTNGKFCLDKLASLSETPRYFHPVETAPPGQNMIYPNRSGILIKYQRTPVEFLIVYNDGVTIYQNNLFQKFSRLKLNDSELQNLLRGFEEADFNALPHYNPRFDRPEARSVSLICSRYQRVLIDSHKTQLAAILDELERIVARINAGTHYVLSYKTAKKLAITPWPFDSATIKRFAGIQELPNRPQNRIRWFVGPKEYPSIYQNVADALPEEHPTKSTLMDLEFDPLRGVYFTEDGTLYRITQNYVIPLNSPELRKSNLTVMEIASPSKVMAMLKENAMDWMNFSGTFLWPQELGTDLTNIPPDGVVVSDQEFEAHKEFYLALLKWGSSSKVNFIIGDTAYQKVTLQQVE